MLTQTHGEAPGGLARSWPPEAAESDARVRVGIREPPPPARTGADSQPAASGAREGTPGARDDPLEVLRGALQATKANGQPDWQIRVSAARTLAALPPEEPEPEPEPDSATFVYDLPPGSGPILHCAPPPMLAPATATEPSAEPLPEPGFYVFQGEQGPMIPLVKHAADDGAPVHFLRSHAAAAELLRAFGGDPRILDTIPDADPQANTP